MLEMPLSILWSGPAAHMRSLLRFLHRNPVARGLVEKPEDCPWSSFRHDATGAEGTVEIESEWTARRRKALGVRLMVRAGPGSRFPPWRS